MDKETIGILEEVIHSHRDPNSIQYNNCDEKDEECMWCLRAKAVIKNIEARINKEPPGQYYLLETHGEVALVHGYENPITNCFGYGFNVSDGGGFLPDWDLIKDTIIKPVEIKISD